MRNVIVMPYDSGWKQDFEDIKRELQKALGELALSIEHVGSTSVPGLSAKPIIDIDAVIVNEDVLGEVIEALEKAGYFYEGDIGIKGREAFGYEGKTHLREHHLYVCPQDSPELRRHLGFRDWLRSHPEDVREYSRIKEEAAALYPHDIEGYMQHKSQVIEEIYRKAGLLGMELIKVFESERISFVKPSETLIDDYLTMVNDKENVGRFFGGAHRESYTEADEISWVQKKLSEDAPVYSMIEKETGDFIGNVELMDMALSQAELGIAITACKQNMGYGTEAIAALTRFGLKDLGFDRIFLRTNPSNLRAIHVYEKCGYAEYDRTEEHVWMEYKGEIS